MLLCFPVHLYLWLLLLPLPRGSAYLSSSYALHSSQKKHQEMIFFYWDQISSRSHVQYYLLSVYGCLGQGLTSCQAIMVMVSSTVVFVLGTTKKERGSNYEYEKESNNIGYLPLNLFTAVMQRNKCVSVMVRS
jgi:hypothetical protein